MKEETKKWLEKANQDMDMAQYSFNGKKLDAAAFYSQQAVEKQLKAFQIEKFSEFDKTHDLISLAKKLNAPKEILDCCKDISPYYTVTRYPDLDQSINKEETIRLMKKSRRVMEWVNQSLKS
jgi:HEPN domain-containing protein